MKLTFQQDAILNGINIVLKAVPSKTTMPILECIFIDATGTEIKLTANDTELGIETTVEGTILERGKIALDAKLLSEIVRKLSSAGDSMVTIESDEKLTTVISCENSVFHIQGRDGEEFAYLPYIEKDHYISLSQFTLKEIIRQTIFSIAPNDSNKMMTGELFQVSGSQLKVVSLDGHRISIRNVELKENYHDIKVIVPGKTSFCRGPAPPFGCGSGCSARPRPGIQKCRCHRGWKRVFPLPAHRSTGSSPPAFPGYPRCRPP